MCVFQEKRTNDLVTKVKVLSKYYDNIYIHIDNIHIGNTLCYKICVQIIVIVCIDFLFASHCSPTPHHPIYSHFELFARKTIVLILLHIIIYWSSFFINFLFSFGGKNGWKKKQQNNKPKKMVSNVYEVKDILDKRIHNREVFRLKIILLGEIQQSRQF